MTSVIVDVRVAILITLSVLIVTAEVTILIVIAEVTVYYVVQGEAPG